MCKHAWEFKDDYIVENDRGELLRVITWECEKCELESTEIKEVV